MRLAVVSLTLFSSVFAWVVMRSDAYLLHMLHLGTLGAEANIAQLAVPLWPDATADGRDRHGGGGMERASRADFDSDVRNGLMQLTVRQTMQRE